MIKTIPNLKPSRMTIIGVLVHCRPEKTVPVGDDIVRLGGEIHAVTDEGRMVVTLEDENEQTLSDALIEMQSLDGVFSAVMVYHENFEEEPDLGEASS